MVPDFFYAKILVSALNDDVNLEVCNTPALQGDIIGVYGLGQFSRLEPFYPRSLLEAYFEVNYLRNGFVPVADELELCREEDISAKKIMTDC